MIAAQEHPELFDGIVAGSPGFRLVESALEGSIFRAQLAAGVAPIGADGLPDITNPLTAAEKAVVRQRILDQCDALDGATDGMVGRISACHPDPAQWVCAAGQTGNCLSAAKADYVKNFFAGAKTSSGRQIYAPWPYDPGMVDTLGTPNAFFYTIFAGEASHVYTTPPTLTADLLGCARTADLDTEFLKTFAVTEVYKRSAYEFTNGSSPDMDAFRARNGKILYFNGTADWAFSFNDLAAYHDKVRTRYGDAEAGKFARAFAVPGMDHCSGGADGTDQFDAFGAIVKWVEEGVAPDVMMSTARAAAGVSWPGRTRPLCAYPKEAVYNGSGDIEQASNFHCE
ncbi:MAG: tannase/feruloyl esterase family alpha/beta hydrolase [Burkholderiaceae bacterium]